MEPVSEPRNRAATDGAGQANRTYSLYKRFERLPLGVGRALFSRTVQIAAPYFLSIPATIESVEPGEARAKMRHLPWVRNHIGSVHAIALCNLAELTMGLAAEATVPASHRWIPKAMSVSYKAKARGTMHATASLALPDPPPDGEEVVVQIPVTDDGGTEVFRAEITLWITAA